MAKAEDPKDPKSVVTVFTIDAQDSGDQSCPSLCQIIKGLCYSPVCCSVSQRLRSLQGISQSVLATLHIMVGLLNIGVGSIIISRFYPWRYMQLALTFFPVWLGGIFILFGIVGMLSDKYPSPCLVILNVILNLLPGVGFAIAGIVMYSFSTTIVRIPWQCSNYWNKMPSSPSEDDRRVKCIEGHMLVQMFLKSINALLIILSVLEICVAISSVVLGIKALRSSMKAENKKRKEPLEEITAPV